MLASITVLASITAWVAVLGPLVTIAATLLTIWWKRSPERRAIRKRKTNVEIHKEVASGDADALKRRIDRMRAES